MWEEAGVVHAPGEPVCGPEPRDMVAPICDAVEGVWVDTVTVAEPEFQTCLGAPPEGVAYPVCDVVTGEWVTEYTAISVEDVIESGEGVALAPEEPEVEEEEGPAEGTAAYVVDKWGSDSGDEADDDEEEPAADEEPEASEEETTAKDETSSEEEPEETDSDDDATRPG